MKKIIGYIKQITLGLLISFAAFSCSEDDSASVVTAAFAVSEDSELEVGYTITFSSESEGAFSYLWSFGDGQTAIGSEVTHVYTEAGDYEVALEASGNGTRDLYSETVTIGINNSELYFIDNDALKMRKLIIGDVTMIEDVFDLPGFCIGMAYDDVNEELYYSDDDAWAVYKTSVNGGAEIEIASGLNGPRDLAVDTENNILYFTERSADQITKVDLLDNSVSTMYSVADDGNFLLPVGLDLYEGNLYATAVDIGAETVWVGNVDGSGIENIIDYTAGGYGYGLEIDKVNGKIYFDDNDGGNLLRANLDGTEVETVGTATDRVYGIAIFNEIGKVFWVGRDGIVSYANLDGSEEQQLVDLGVDVRGLILRKVD